MEEKVLIKSEVDQNAKKILLGVIFGCLAVAILMFIISFMAYHGPHNRYISVYSGLYSSRDIYEYEDPVYFAKLVEGGKYVWHDVWYWEFAYIYVCFAFILFAGITGVIFLVLSKSELTVYGTSVKGTSASGKQVTLPLYQISAYSTSAFLSTISVATSSGLTKFGLIKNYKEIGDVLSKLINERQENTQTQQQAVQQTAPENNLAELKTLKDLLDAGVITQEEFDAKKKIILNL